MTKQDIYTFNNNIEELGETREEYNQDMINFGINECILNNQTFTNSLDNLKGIDKLKQSQINTIIHNTLLSFNDSFNELAQNNIFDFDTFVAYQDLICKLIITKVQKAIDNTTK